MVELPEEGLLEVEPLGHRDLGPDTAKIAQSTTQFDPAPGWTPSKDAADDDGNNNTPAPASTAAATPHP